MNEAELAINEEDMVPPLTDNCDDNDSESRD
jgi:hypothetical protein